MECLNCGKPINNDDDRTGLIHDDGKYSCFVDSKGKPSGPVAEVGADFLTEEEIDDHSGHNHAEFAFGIICLI